MKKIKLLLLSISSAILFALAWPAVGGFSALIFLAFIPLLYVEEEIFTTNGSKLKLLLYSYITFLLFNFLTTWWIYNASDWGAAMAIICNAIFMTTVFYLFHLTKKWVGIKQGYIALILYWIAFEYIHLNWELSWSWLTFGNVFANNVKAIQWYEFTGVLGGSILVLIVNVLFYLSIKNYLSNKKNHLRPLGAAVFLLIGSLFYSEVLYDSNEETVNNLQAVIIQPNIDPYTDKFGGMADSDQIDLMVSLSREAITDSTDYLLLPETAIPIPTWEHDLEYQYATEEFRKIIKDYPKLNIIVGMLSSKLFLEGDSMPVTAKKLPGSGYYDNYNSAMYLDSSSLIRIHRKSKLVLGAEKIPFMKQLPILKKLSISLGGTTGRYGTQDKPTVFFDAESKNAAAPIICYESIFGEYVNRYALQGATFYAIITNDGWWGDTPGYKQHLAYARLRSIEGRKDLIRSANTGVSAVINKRGDILAETNYWERDVVKSNFSSNSKLTFYVKYGDYLGRIAAFISPLLLLLTLVKSLNKTEQRLKKD